MEKYVITEDEKNRILNLHIERTEKLYLTEQAKSDVQLAGEYLTSEDRKYQFKLSKDQTFWYHATDFPFEGTTGTMYLFKNPKKYQFDTIVNRVQVLNKIGTWIWDKTNKKVVVDPPTQPPVTGKLYEWAKCIKDTPHFKDIKNINDYNGKKRVSQGDTSLKTSNVFYEDGTYKYIEDNGNVTSVGKWKCLPVVGLIIELENGKKYFNKDWQGDADGINIPSFDTIVEKGGVIIGKIGDKLVKWYNDTERWLEDKSNGGSSNDNKPCTPLTDSEKKDDDFYNIRIPGDTKYIYGKENGDWFTKNIVNTNQFNLTKCNYKESIKKAIKKLEKEGKQVSSPQKPELDNATSAPNDKVNIAVVEPKPETIPLATSDKVLDGQEEMSATTKL